MNILKKIFILVFIMYWGITLIYVLPNNYIRVKCAKIVSFMDTFFFQSWNFFAPPPDYNLKLYYVFKDYQNKVYILEAIGNILKEKKNHAPFNATEEYLDYVISGAATHVIDEKINYFDYFKFSIKDSSDTFYNDTAIKTVNKNYNINPGYLTLINYSKLVKEKNLKNINLKSCKFVLTSLSIPKFSDRYTNKRNERKIFESFEF